MSMRRSFHGEPVRRLIVSVPLATVSDVDKLLTVRQNDRHPANGNRSEFIRMAVTEKLDRDEQAKNTQWVSSGLPVASLGT